MRLLIPWKAGSDWEDTWLERRLTAYMISRRVHCIIWIFFLIRALNFTKLNSSIIWISAGVAVRVSDRLSSKFLYDLKVLVTELNLSEAYVNHCARMVSWM